jgi:hypothetical protein
MNIELSRLNEISTISIDSLSDRLNSNEICFISARFYLFESLSDVNFSNAEITRILHLFKGIYFVDLDLAELFNVEAHLLIFAFELARSLQEFDIEKLVTPNSADGV